mmetsp:Transcript_10185/g.25504  ORF Transcript_10185/g.25504 Transcript_10185/m.25504 type:complete len:241 (+) Transcript_10185:608-1330(+)
MQAHGERPQHQVHDDHGAQQVEVLKRHRQRHGVSNLLLRAVDAQNQVNKRSQYLGRRLRLVAAPRRDEGTPCQCDLGAVPRGRGQQRVHLHVAEEAEPAKLYDVGIRAPALHLVEMQDHRQDHITSAEPAVALRLVADENAEVVAEVVNTVDHASGRVVEVEVSRVALVGIEDLEESGDTRNDLHAVPIQHQDPRIGPDPLLIVMRSEEDAEVDRKEKPELHRRQHARRHRGGPPQSCPK